MVEQALYDNKFLIFPMFLIWKYVLLHIAVIWSSKLRNWSNVTPKSKNRGITHFINQFLAIQIQNEFHNL